MRIYPAAHYTMGGLWVDYDLMSTIPGCFVLGEANFSDHGANRLGASALMQGLCDGYFVIPYTVAGYLAQVGSNRPEPEGEGFEETKERINDRINRLMSIKGKRSARSFHHELGKIMWEYCGIARNEEGLKKALEIIPALREEFWSELRITGEESNLNIELEQAGRVADFLEFGELMCRDALDRDESCGGHFREEHQSFEGEAVRDDENFGNVSLWDFEGEEKAPTKHVEDLDFENVYVTVRSYK